MSTFLESALPEVPVEELIQLNHAIGLYYNVLLQDTVSGTAKEALPLVSRMYGEIIEETERRLKGLSHAI